MEGLGERADDGGVLEVDVDAGVREGAEDVLQAGMGSAPSMRAFWTSVKGSRAMAPVRSVTRSRVRSWKATTTPSAVACASVSR